jgi:ComF family protein
MQLDAITASRSHIATRLASAIFGLSNVFVPPVCQNCRTSLADHHALCPTCWRDIAFIRAPLCERMGIPLPFDTGGPSISALAFAEPPDYDRARAAAHFGGTARKLVHDFKYADRQEVRVLLGNWLTAAGAELLADAHLILPVPMSRRRLFWRKFNQAAILAHELGRRSGVAVDTSSLRRRRATKPQVGLTRAQRHANMEGAFAILKRRRTRIEDANILLIDDVVTTGATVNACARALKRAGAARVDVLAVCMVAGDLAQVP